MWLAIAALLVAADSSVSQMTFLLTVGQTDAVLVGIQRSSADEFKILGARGMIGLNINAL